MKTSQNESPPSPYLMGGSTRIALDTLVQSLFLDSSRSEIFSQFDEVKKQLQETDHQEERLVSVGLGDTRMRWNLQRMGTRRYPYVLKSGDITLLLSRRKADSPMPSGEVHIGSMSCQYGALSAFHRVKGWLNFCRIKVVKDIVSRVDLCADVSGYNLNDPLMRIYDPKFYVRRTIDYNYYGKTDSCTGVMVGGKKAPLKLRIYDKIEELNKRENEAKKIFFESLWGGMPAHVTRVEFQMRRDILKEFLEIGCLSDLLNNVHKIWRYLTDDWFRHSVRPVDRKNRNQDKMTTSPFWSLVQSASIVDEKCIRRKSKNIMKPLSMLKAQVRGLLVTILAGSNIGSDEYFEIHKQSTEIVHDVMEDAMSSPRQWRKKFMERALSTVIVHDEIEEVNAFDYGCFDKQLELDFAY